MTEEEKAFFQLVFEPNESTCFTNSVNGSWVYNIEHYRNKPCFFCINPLDPYKDNNPVKVYHNKDVPRRADDNIVAYRTFLVEMDKVPLAQQKKHIKAIKMPYSTVVFSGGKSYHFLIVLEDPCQSLDEYKEYIKRIQRAVGLNLVDKSTKNPSRLSRYPGAYRQDKDQYQTLEYVGNRVSKQELEDWLISLRVYKQKPKANKPKRTIKDDELPSKSNLLPFTLKFLANGAKEGERNQSLYRAACDYATCNFPIEKAIEDLGNLSNLEENEVELCIESAYTRLGKL